MLRSVGELLRDRLRGGVVRNRREPEILSSQVRLLYANAGLSAFVTILAATILGRLEWGAVSNAAVVGWWIYMALLAVSRYVLARRFRAAAPGLHQIRRWATVYTLAAGLAGAGWGTAGLLLYSDARLINQVLLVFVLGGMMLGASSLLAPRPEAFLAFLLPAGFTPAVRLMLQGGEAHFAMGVLAAVFTVAVLIATARIYLTIDSSLRLQFENRDLLEDVRAAKDETEALNQALERRVQERTAELRKSTELLEAEMARRERMEEDLLRAHKLEALGVLAGGIAHDFNNLLTIIQGNIEIARNRRDTSEPVTEILDEAANTCRRAAFLSSQLLTFAKGGAPVRHLVSAAQLVTDSVQLARAGSPVNVTVAIAEDLRFVRVDPGQIRQVFHNILLNASQAMTGAGIVEVRAENAAGDGAGAEPRVAIHIRDYGCGIPADILPRIFDPYFTTKPGASGFGLATAYAIVAKHGGHISVDSKPGFGTVFTVELPASTEVPAPPPPIAEEEQLCTERLLVMDDEEALRNLLIAVLTPLGYEVEAARDGAEAIALYERAKASGRAFDAVLLDLTVGGGMGGIETAAKLKEIDPASKLIVSSGYSASPVMSDFAKYGFEAVIPKPWTARELTEVIRKVLVSTRDRKPD